MLEVVFSDSAAGTMAVAIGHKGFLGGATSVIISDGTVSFFMESGNVLLSQVILPA